MRKGRWAGAAVAALLAPPVSADAAPATLRLAPLAEEALHACKARELETALRDRLRKGKRFRFLAQDTRAQLVLEVTECSMLRQRRRVFDSGGRPVTMPTEGGGVARGGETETGLRLEAQGVVVLKARLGAAPRLLEVSSAPKDRNLSQAADSLQRAIDRMLEERGGWLLGHSRP
jgi:hypothetical protein